MYVYRNRLTCINIQDFSQGYSLSRKFRRPMRTQNVFIMHFLYHITHSQIILSLNYVSHSYKLSGLYLKNGLYMQECGMLGMFRFMTRGSILSDEFLHLTSIWSGTSVRSKFHWSMTGVRLILRILRRLV